MVAHGVARWTANFVPLLMTRHLNLSRNYYAADPARRDASGLVLLSGPARSALLAAYATWALLTFLLVVPAFWFAARDHAQALSEKERTLVTFRRLDDPRSLSFLQLLETAVARTGWRRAFRLSAQFGLAAACAWGVFGLVAWAALSRMENGRLVADWVVREYLNFDLHVSISGMFKNWLFWLDPRRLWVSDGV